MLTSSTQLQNALKQGSVLRSKPRVIAEWNHNRYTPIQTVDNYGYAEKTYGYDLEVFPIESITEPIRPTAGLFKARANEGGTVQGYSDTPRGYRSYTASPDAKYKYWTSPQQANTQPYTGDPVGGYTLPATVQPYVLYKTPALTNKLYICLENSWASPKSWQIQITTNGTSWTTVSTNQTPDSSGRVALYLQNDGTWSKTVSRDNVTYIRGIRLVVKSMGRWNSWFNLIELGARLERDLSPWVIDCSVKNEMGDEDFITPLGVISSNTANVTLSNLDGLFNHDNPESPYHGLIDSNVKFTIDTGIDTSDWGGTGYEYVRQATMFSEVWGGGEEASSVSLKDASKFLQEINPLTELMEDVSIGMAIWRILDSVGFNDYSYSREAEAAATRIAYFWTDENQTVWDVIQGLCRTTQSAAWFDEYGILQIKTRDAAFNRANPVSWTLDYAQNGSKQPDIVSLDVGDNYEANKVIVKYKTTKLAEDEQGRPISEIIWQPEDTVTLRSSALASSVNATDMHFWLDKKDIETWPYEGMVNIRGELIKYKGKGYRYYPKGYSYTGKYEKDTIFKVIYSLDEKRQIDNELSNPDHMWRNYFTGYMKVEERGYDNTFPASHDVIPDIWHTNGSYYGKTGGAQRRWNGGTIHMPADSKMRLQTNKTFKTDNWYTARRGSWDSDSPKHIGTRMMFPSSPKGTHQTGGIWVWGNIAQNEMYVIEIQTTKTVNRATNNEIRVMKRNDGRLVPVGTTKGAAFAIDFDKWYDIDVVMTGDKPDFTVCVNGTIVLRVEDTKSKLPLSGRAGLYVRGNCVADFEYFYMMASGGIQDTDLDNSSYLDIIRGGYFSSQYYRDFVTKTRYYKKRRGKKTVLEAAWYAQRYFDEFGMQVHEFRPYEVTFEKFPVLYSSLYVSNDSQVVIDEYMHNPFKAKFTIANAHRYNAIVSGEDTLTFGKDNPVNQQMAITGRTIQVAEAKEYEVKDEQAIRARGETALEFDSEWIQSEAAAKALGDWIVKNWAEPSDRVEVEVFGNPLFQVGDIISINYPIRDMAASTHKYFIISVNQDWENGLTTSLVLRRARI